MLLEGLSQLKNLVTTSEIEPATFRLVEEYLNQIRYRAPSMNNMGMWLGWERR
jgi:hypothetical protein